VVGADLGRQAPGHLAHRGQEREAPVGRLDRLVGDARRAGLGQAAGELRRRGEVQVREEHLPRREPLVLAVERLLHLEHHLGLAPHGVDVDDGGTRRAVVVVGHGAAVAGGRLDQDVVPAPDELGDPSRRQRDAVLVRLDLLGDADLHAVAIVEA
jgi:hypothetical protein